MNLLRGQLGRDGDELFVTLGDQNVSIPPSVLAERPALDGFVGKPIVAGIRPEDIADASLSTDVPESRRLQTTASLVESLGSEIIVHFPMAVEPFEIMDSEFEGEDAVATATDDTGNYIYVARVNPRSPARIGQPIELAVDSARFRFFDPSDGSAIRT
jgi:multiple sugar transport system ATP-binding protein